MIEGKYKARHLLLEVTVKLINDVVMKIKISKNRKDVKN